MTEAVKTTTTRVVVADDHPIVRSGIINHLTDHPEIEVVGQAVDGDSTWELVRTLKPDVLVLDINMPGMKAVDVVREIKDSWIPTQVVILTAHDDIEYVLTLLKAGARGYLLKDEDPATIITAICTVAQGKTWLSMSIMERVIDHTVREPDRPTEAELTERENEVLQLLAKGLENQEIADMLNISERTVRFHLHNIYAKLGLQHRSAAIAWAVQQRLDRT